MVRDPQSEARALGDPTRHRLFRYIVDASAPVGVRELTDHVQLNHNAVRQHLAVLKDAGLVVEEIERRRDRPGRPRLLYRLDPEVAGRWGTAGAYAWLAGLLSTAVSRKQDVLEVGRRDGLRRALALSGTGDPADLLEEQMLRGGFRPRRAERGRRLHFVLDRCPFAEVAAADPDTICRLHLGMVEGITDGLGDMAVERLVSKDPRRAGCRLVVRCTSAPDPAQGHETAVAVGSSRTRAASAPADRRQAASPRP